MELKCVTCGETAVAISGGDSYCQIHLERNRNIYWGENWEKSLEEDK